MSRILLSIFLLFPLASCTAPNYEGMQTAMEDRARQSLSRYFLRQFGNSFDRVLGALAAEGGFLDNPLVKIMLPPPVGLMLDVGQAFYNDPKAALLDTLINKAAENVTLGAAPVLKAALEEIILNKESEVLFSGDATAVTDHLRKRTKARLRETLMPSVAQALEDTGAVAIYKEMTEVSAIVSGMEEEMDGIEAILSGKIPDADSEEMDVVPDKLDEYVTDKTIDGIFLMLEQREKALRQQLEM